MMSTNSVELIELTTTTIRRQVAGADTITRYREPLVAFVAADDPRFAELKRVVHPTHMLPGDLLPGARSVVSFFLPFDERVVQANARERERVAREWAVAYVETNALIGRINAALIEQLAGRGIRAAAEPATHNFDPVTLVSRWAHKSVAVIAGLGSFGLHHLVITDAGCAGRFGSLVLDADPSGLGSSGQGLPASHLPPRERCLYFHDGSCLECVLRCPAGALDESGELDKQRCRTHCHATSEGFEDLGDAHVCGKCTFGPCALGPAV